jgi:transposase InsO family protein
VYFLAGITHTSPGVLRGPLGFQADEEEVYCAAVLDVLNRTIVGWSIADRMRAELVVDALEMARWRRRPTPGTIVHSDRGSPIHVLDLRPPTALSTRCIRA